MESAIVMYMDAVRTWMPWNESTRVEDISRELSESHAWTKWNWI
jgi:hypothetical protein